MVSFTLNIQYVEMHQVVLSFCGMSGESIVQ